MQVPTFKAGLKVKGELCSIGIIGGTLNGSSASADT